MRWSIFQTPVVNALWLASVAYRVFRNSVGEISVPLLGPFRGLPSLVEQLDTDCCGSSSRVVVSLHNPASLAFGYLFSTPHARRKWLTDKIRGLPRGDSHAYLFHYWNRSGIKQTVLTSDPERGLSPPPSTARTVRNRVLAAYAGQTDVTESVRKISASFHESEPEVCILSLQAYIWREHAIRIAVTPVVITDGSLRRSTYGLE